VVGEEKKKTQHMRVKRGEHVRDFQLLQNNYATLEELVAIVLPDAIPCPGSKFENLADLDSEVDLKEDPYAPCPN